MKRSVRFTKDEYSYILRCEEYLKVASFIPQKFDDSDIINMAINYAWKKKKTELDLIFQNSYKSIENLNKAMGFLKTVFDRTGLINEFKEEDKKESKTIFLSNESENIIQKLMEKYKEKSITEIIKIIHFGILTNPDYVIDIAVRLLVIQLCLYISLDKVSKKYNYKDSKEDILNFNIPRIDIKDIEIDNYDYMFNKLLELSDFSNGLQYVKNFELSDIFLKNDPVIHDLMNYGIPSMLGFENKEIPKSIKPIDLVATKFLSRAMPGEMAIKLITMTTLYTGFKERTPSVTPSYDTILDEVSVIIATNKLDSLESNYKNIYKSLYNAIKDCRDYVNSFKDKN
jgi:hypothetical protein